LSQTLKRGWSTALRTLAVVALLAPAIAACTSSGGNIGPTLKRGAFTSAEYGVKVSPRVTNKANPPRGGGRAMVGKPYTVRGKTYVPAHQPDYVETGIASWYGADFHGRRTANGEIFSANAITGAHPTLPLPSYVRVTNLSNGRSMLVRINDRGPYVNGRIVDLSYKTASTLGIIGQGTGHVQVQYVGPAPLEGDDTRMLMASLNTVTPLERRMNRAPVLSTPSSAPDVRVADNGPYSAADAVTDAFKSITSLFSYADGQPVPADLDSAFAAVNAMAERPADLDAWAAAVDEDARDIRLELGTFTDNAELDRIVVAFAAIAAVDEAEVQAAGGTATRLTLSKLKPGVARADVLGLARELGLTGLVLY
jgi:rare lipoprotein A